MTIEEQESLARFKQALTRFDEALSLPVFEGVNLDGSIQGFEFTFELAWKYGKRALVAKGIDARSPRAVIKECYAQNWIDDEATWIEMMNDRNRTSHTYVEAIALEVYVRLADYARVLRTFSDCIPDISS